MGSSLEEAPPLRASGLDPSFPDLQLGLHHFEASTQAGEKPANGAGETAQQPECVWLLI